MINTQLTLDAMVLWEALLDWRQHNTDATVFNAYQDDNGACETRDRVVEITPAFNAAWSYARECGYDESIDWEFAPLWLRTSVAIIEGDWEVKKDWRRIARKLVKDGDFKIIEKSEYVNAARFYAQLHWGYGDLVDDHEEAIEDARVNGEKYTTLLDEIAEECDLNTLDPITAQGFQNKALENACEISGAYGSIWADRETGCIIKRQGNNDPEGTYDDIWHVSAGLPTHRDIVRVDVWLDNGEFLAASDIMPYQLHLYETGDNAIIRHDIFVGSALEAENALSDMWNKCPPAVLCADRYKATLTDLDGDIIAEIGG